MRRGLTVPSGRSGTYARLTTEVARIFAAAYRDAALEAFSGEAGRALVSLALVPLLPLIPIVTACIHAHEVRFGARQFRAFQKASGWPAERPLVLAGLAAPARSLGPA